MVWSKTVFEVFFLDLMAFPMRINVRQKIPQFSIFSNRHWPSRREDNISSSCHQARKWSRCVVALRPIALACPMVVFWTLIYLDGWLVGWWVLWIGITRCRDCSKDRLLQLLHLSGILPKWGRLETLNVCLLELSCIRRFPSLKLCFLGVFRYNLKTKRYGYGLHIHCTRISNVLKPSTYCLKLDSF